MTPAEPRPLPAEYSEPIRYLPPAGASALLVRTATIELQPAPPEVIGDVIEVAGGMYSPQTLADYEIGLLELAVASTEYLIAELARREELRQGTVDIYQGREAFLLELQNDSLRDIPWWQWATGGALVGAVLGVFAGAQATR
ncbi:MAG: hypothetical protein V3U43_00320 [Pseudomonadales bacterium]